MLLCCLYKLQGYEVPDYINDNGSSVDSGMWEACNWQVAQDAQDNVSNMFQIEQMIQLLKQCLSPDWDGPRDFPYSGNNLS